jgi:hypothetical protein
MTFLTLFRRVCLADARSMANGGESWAGHSVTGTPQDVAHLRETADKALKRAGLRVPSKEDWPVELLKGAEHG